MHNTTYKTLNINVDSCGVATVCLACEEKLNAFDEGMIEELTAAFQRLAQQQEVRVVILMADGRAFSAGADPRWIQRASSNSEDENLVDAKRSAAMMRAVHECLKPIVERIQGPAYGGSVGMCCACDIVVASSETRFAVSEAKFGILPFEQMRKESLIKPIVPLSGSTHLAMRHRLE